MGEAKLLNWASFAAGVLNEFHEDLHQEWHSMAQLGCLFDTDHFTHDGSMVLLYMVTWIPSIYPSHVCICTRTMDPMGYGRCYPGCADLPMDPSDWSFSL